MGTTADLIADALIADIQSANPTVDVVKGPIYDLLLAPVPPVLAEVSDTVAGLSNIYSPIVSGDSDNAAVIDTLGTAFKVPQPAGTQCRVSLLFWFTALPVDSISIPAGTAVATTDRTVIYTTEAAVLNVTASTAAQFYNTTTSRYEITIEAVATTSGSAQSVPASRLTSLLSKVDGIDGVYNPAASTVGVDAGDTAEYLTQIQERFLGMDSGSFAYQLQQISASYPNAVVDFVLSTDYGSFRRVLRGDGADCVVRDPDPATATDVFSAAEGTATTRGIVFTLRTQPVIANGIDLVYVNGAPLATGNYSIEYDDTPSTRWSTSAATCVRITSSLKATDTITVHYSYCQACVGIQENVFGVSAGTDFFGINTLVRLAEQVQITVALSVRAAAGIGSDSLSGMNAATMQAISGAVTTYFNSLGFVDSVTSDDLVSYLLARFSNLRQLFVQKFHRADYYAQDVEPVLLKKYEVPIASSTNVSVTQA